MPFHLELKACPDECPILIELIRKECPLKGQRYTTSMTISTGN
jgi:hypothetical protein